jgi:hypothetical protein
LFILIPGKEAPMDLLLTPSHIGSLQTPNRLVRSATAERMADADGHPLPPLTSLCEDLARGGVGLIITGNMYVHPAGKAHDEMTGIYSDKLIPDLEGLARAVQDLRTAPNKAPTIHALVGTALLTGGRKSELHALLVEDIDFDSGFVHFRPNRYYPERKSRHAIRQVPLWPQLRRILVPFVGDRKSGLLFAPVGKPVKHVRESLVKVFKKAEIEKPVGKAFHLFRHT